MLPTPSVEPKSPEYAWKTFLDKHWENSHAFLPNAASRLPLPNVEEDELFDAIVKCTDQYGKGQGQITRLYINNIEINVLRDKKQWLLPNQGDHSFEGYHNRIVEQTGTTDYSLIVTDWHQFDRSIWERIVKTVAIISDLVGISASRIDTQLFLGTYRRTPFGVHVDATSAFHFPIIGHKTMRFWPDQFVSENPLLRHATDYDAYLHASTRVDAQPGDVIYWPSDYWHVGEGDGSLSVTWRFAYWIADGFRQFAARRAAEYLKQKSKNSATAFNAASHGGMVSIDHIDSLINEVSEIATHDDYRDELIRVMLEQVSAFGFLRLPATLDGIALSGQRFRRKDPFKYYLAPLSGNRICVAIAGCSIELTSGPDVEAMIDTLNHGEEFGWLDLMSGNEIQSSQLKAILELGFASGALEYL